MYQAFESRLGARMQAFFVSAALLLAFSLSTAVSATELPCDDSCLSNRGYEHGNLNGWNYDGNVKAQQKNSGHFPNSGHWYAKLHQHSSYLGQSKAAQAGESFTLTAYARRGRYSNESGPPTAYIRLAFKNANGQIIEESVEQITAGSGDYESYTVTGTAPAGTATVKAWVSKPDGKGWVTVDDFCLQKATPPPTCPNGCLDNPGFEDGKLSPWHKSGDVRAQQQTSSHFPNSGHWYAKLHRHSDGLSQLKAASPGDEFMLMAYARRGKYSGESGLPDAEFRIAFLDASGNVLLEESIDITNGNDYQKYTLTGVAPAGTVNARVSVVKPWGEGWVTVDDFCFEKQASSRDYGDAPASYGDASNIARDEFKLGNSIDSEDGSQNSDDADGDDSDGSDDEDGVVFGDGGMGMGEVCSDDNTVKLTVNNTIKNDTYLQGWIDFDGNGTFEDDERMVDIRNIGNGNNQMFEVTYSIPCDAVAGPTFARFRYDDDDGAGPTGNRGTIGEVEDYAFLIKPGAPTLDYGDAPVSYSDAARAVDESLKLGSTVDADDGSQNSDNADGDDSDGTDDEDGIDFGGMPMAPVCSDGNLVSVSYMNTTGSPAYLKGWVDFNRDGDFTDADEMVAEAIIPVGSGTAQVAWSVPCDATPGDTFSRFIISSAPIDGPETVTEDLGEVEDYPMLLKTSLFDAGDLPDTFGTLIGSNGPRHTIVAGCYLGETVDADQDGNPSDTAEGDDTSGLDDEDGVIPRVTLLGETEITVVAQVDGCLDTAAVVCWVDYNADGTFGDPEAFEIAIPASGTFMLTNQGSAFPPGATNVGVRCRLSSDPNNDFPGGSVVDGEVEDYVVDLLTSLPVELTSFTALPQDDYSVDLAWTTASETDNAGFSVELSVDNGPFEERVFVDGRGTVSDETHYTHTLRDVPVGTIRVRLKQLDFAGTFAYSPEIELSVDMPTQLRLDAAYPNPFNPQARFSFAVKDREPVQVGLYDLQGRLVDMLFEGEAEPVTSYELTIDGTGLASGTYVVRLSSRLDSTTRTVVLMK